MSSRRAVLLPFVQRLLFAGLILVLCAVLAIPLLVASPAAASTTAEGTLEVFHEDHLADGDTHHRYVLRGRDGSATELLFAGAGPDTLGGHRVRVVGEAAGRGRLRVASQADVQVVEGPATTGYPTGTARSRLRVAVILFKFADTTEEPITTVDADRLILGAPAAGVTTHASTNDYYFENSFGGWSLDGAAPTADDVFGWVTIDNKSTDSCAYERWGETARAQAQAAGFVDGNYDHVIHVMPPSTCTFGGVAQLPGKYTWVVAKPFRDLGMDKSIRLLASHELGHNFNLWHSGSWRCTSGRRPVVLSSKCSQSYYGDPFSVMGNLGERHLTNYQKWQMGWFTGETAPPGTTTYTLHPIETGRSDGGLQALRIPRSSSEFYYVEHRTSFGFDTFGPDDTVDDGVLIRVGPDVTKGHYSWLLDATPETDTFFDAAFLQGTTFDSGTGVKVEVGAVADGTATVTVTVPSSTSTKPGKGNSK